MEGHWGSSAEEHWAVCSRKKEEVQYSNVDIENTEKSEKHSRK